MHTSTIGIALIFIGMITGSTIIFYDELVFLGISMQMIESLIISTIQFIPIICLIGFIIVIASGKEI